MRTTIDRLPLVYLNESRDFQLFARLWNTIFLGQWNKARSILQVLDPLTCPEQYLDALRDRLGFEPMIKIAPNDMRIILKAFPWLVYCRQKVVLFWAGITAKKEQRFLAA